MGNDINLCCKKSMKIDPQLMNPEKQESNSVPERSGKQKRCFSVGASYKQNSPVTTNTSNKSYDSSDSNFVKGYEIIKEIGAGGFGKVFEVTNSKKQKLALKMINIPRDCPSNCISLEAKAMIKAQHPSIIKVQEFFFWKDDSQLIIIMQFGSHDIRSILKDFKAMQSIKILEIMLNMAKGIEHLHKINIIHRDLKPQNILMLDGKIKITDFGLAKAFEKDMALKTQAGTPMYLAPQILSGSSYSEKVDVWSLGVIFLELITAKNITELCQNCLYPALNKFFPQKTLLQIYDTDMRSLIAKMLNKQPEKRISMSKVIETIQKMHDNQQIFPGVQEVESLIKKNKFVEASEALYKNCDGKKKLHHLIKKLRKQNRHDQVACFALQIWKKDPNIVYEHFQFDEHEKEGKMKIGKSTDDKTWLFIGQTVFGKMNGKGKTIWSDGESYEGQYKSDKQHGTGTYYFKNGDKYSGTWCNDEITGKGTYWHVDGDWYEGEHKNGLRHGFGTYHYKERGDKYSGRWENGKKHGKGIYTWKDGKKFEGEYQDDIIEGEQILTCRSHRTAQESNSMIYKKRKQSKDLK